MHHTINPTQEHPAALMSNGDGERVPRHQIIRTVRHLMIARPLQTHEARHIAERQATRLRALLDLDEPVLDLDAIAGLPRLELVTRAGLPVSGFSEWHKSRWLIAINADDHPTRQRFTLAHELKHVLDNPYIDTIYPNHNGAPSHERAEQMCDYFAACLLMPRPLVKAAWTSGHQRTDNLAAHFAVSPAAMGVRLHQLGLATRERRCNTQIRTRKGHRYQRAAAPSIATVTAPVSGACP